jgi:RNA polymerase sigma-70 factor, ECF subfamily
MPPGPDEVTRILEELAHGDKAAADRLMPLVYDELRALAGYFFQNERAGHTLQPTALVHEAFVKLAKSGGGAGGATNRAHFMALAAKVMRQLLIDHARGKQRVKRGGAGAGASAASNVTDERTMMALDQTPAPDRIIEADVLDLDDALRALSTEYPRAAQVVEWRFFGGLTSQEIAALLGVGDATVERDWVLARGWLKRRMVGASAGGQDGAA